MDRLNILIYHPRMYGDIILGTTGAKYLKKKYPNSSITYVTGAKCLTETNPFIDRSLELRLHRRLEKPFFNFISSFFKKSYFLLHWLPSPNMLGSYMKDLELEPQLFQTKLYLTSEDRILAQEYIRQNSISNQKPNGQPLIALQNDFTRVWNEHEFKILRNELFNSFNVVEIGAGMKLGSKTLNMRQSAAVIEQCNVFIGGISGNAHAAVAVGTPTICTPKVFNPKWDMPEYYQNKDKNSLVKHKTILPLRENFCGSYECVKIQKNFVEVDMGDYSSKECSAGFKQSCVHSISAKQILDELRKTLAE